MHKHHYAGSESPTFTVPIESEGETIYTDQLDHSTPDEAAACAMVELERAFTLALDTN